MRQCIQSQFIPKPHRDTLADQGRQADNSLLSARVNSPVPPDKLEVSVSSIETLFRALLFKSPVLYAVAQKTMLFCSLDHFNAGAH